MSAPESSKTLIRDAEDTFSREGDLLLDAPPEKDDQDWKTTLALKIFDDVFKSGHMPLFTAYFHDYDFYPLHIDPAQLTLMEHFQIYMRNMPFVILYYASIVLRGVSQVFLCNHPITGLFICIGLSLTSPTLMVYALLGAIFENIGAFLVCQPVIADMERGLYG